MDILPNFHWFLKIAIQKHKPDDSFLFFFLTKRKDSDQVGTDFVETHFAIKFLILIKAIPHGVLRSISLNA